MSFIVDFDAPSLRPWYCLRCGRFEAATRRCPECGGKGRAVSRFEWFLADAIGKHLDRLGAEYEILEQWPLRDHRGFVWYFDLAVGVWRRHKFVGIIEVNGPDHAKQRKYSGKGGGYTRDYDKDWEFHSQGFHRRGHSLYVVSNDQCRKRDGSVARTAEMLAEEMYGRANTPSSGV